MDKYEYKLKTEQMLELMEEGAYDKAAEVADTIDWKRVRNVTMLSNVSEIYEKNNNYQRSYDILHLAYHRAAGSRKIVSRLCTLALKTKNVDEAIDYYDDFVQIAPKDPNRFLLRYQILKEQRAPIEQQIKALEEFKKAEYIEEWAYELAELYDKAGMTAECLEECDNLILWFNEGKYVYQAMELKMKHKPLTEAQKEKYNSHNNKLSGDTEEMPDLSAYKVVEEKQIEEKGNKESSAEKSSEEADEKTEEKKADNAETKGESEDSEEKAEEKSAVSKGKLLRNTMKLEEALKSLLHLGEVPKKEEEAETGEEKITEESDLDKAGMEQSEEVPEEEESLEELEEAIQEIESVMDLGLAEEIKEEKRRQIEKTDSDVEELEPKLDLENEVREEIKEETSEEEKVFEEEIIEEEIPEEEKVLEEEIIEEEAPEEEKVLEEEIIEEEISEEEKVLEEEIIEEEISEEEKVLEEEIIEEETPKEEEILEEEIIEEEIPEEEEVLEEETLEEDKEEYEEEFLNLDEAEEILDEEYAEDYEDSLDDLEKILREQYNEIEKIDYEDIELFEEEKTVEDVEEEFIEMSKEKQLKKKDVEQILPPDIQRLIDEIEGVVPEEEEEELKEVFEEDVQWNKGLATEELRIEEIFAELDEDEYEEEDYEEESDYEEEDYEEEDYEEESDYEEEDYEEEDYEEEAYEEEDYEEESAYEEEAYEEEDYEEESAYEEEAYEEESAYEEEAYEEEAYEEEDYEEEDYDEFDYEEVLEDDVEEYVIEDEEEFEEEDESEEEWEDDREIPDEDEIDILSATTPLSRKETAKLHATGKTAPLPLGELSDAVSLGTGFVVHGRYDLQMQSGIGTRAGLTEEQKKLFSYFVPVRGMSEQLVDVLEQDKNCTNRRGTSRTGNLVVIGNKGNGKTVLAVDVVKAIQKQRKIRQGKVAIVTGEALNQKKPSDVVDKLYGGALIIEKAGKMNEKTVSRLNKAMERDTGEMLVVLEDQRKPLDRLLTSNREFRRKFTSRLEVPIFINDELVTFGQTYAQENGYRIDEMGILALYSRIDMLQREDHAVTVSEVKEVMDEAIMRSQKASAKKLMKRVFGKNTDSEDRVILSEKDFNI
ncbi:MAG: hypothetical protein U0L05_03460 [Schaedlerella sp.]|nr:hypothetical protein [Schaedlerella sp.]